MKKELTEKEFELMGAIMRNYNFDTEQALEFVNGNCNYYFLDKTSTLSDEENMSHAYIKDIYGNISNAPKEILEDYLNLDKLGMEVDSNLEKIISNYGEHEKEKIDEMDYAELGEWYINLCGDVKSIGAKAIENCFDHYGFGRALLLEHILDKQTMIATWI